MKINSPFDSQCDPRHLSTNPTALRVTLMTLRAIEIVERCLNFFVSVSKNDSIKANVCGADAANPLRGNANTRHPSHSHYRSALATANF